MILAIFPTMCFLFVSQMGILIYVVLFLSGALAMAANPGAIVWGQNFLPDNPGMASGHDAWFIFWFRWYRYYAY